MPLLKDFYLSPEIQGYLKSRSKYIAKAVFGFHLFYISVNKSCVARSSKLLRKNYVMLCNCRLLHLSEAADVW